MYLFDTEKMLHCRRFGRIKQKNGWERLEYRSIEDNLFVLLIEGQADFYVAQVHHVLRAGDVLIIPAHTLYRAYTEDFCEYYFCHFTGEIQQAEAPVLPVLPRIFSFDLPRLENAWVCFPDKTETGRSFRRVYNNIIACADYQSWNTQSGQRLLECEFLKVLLTLADISSRKNDGIGQPSVLDKMAVYIKKNLAGHLGVQDVCAHCGVSVSYAARLFKKHMHMTVTEYINSEKLYYACELINNTNLSLTEIADYLGYCDVYYFSRRFKQKFGKSPTKLFSKR